MMWTQKEASILEDLKKQEQLCVDKYDVKPESATKVCATFPELVEGVCATM